MSATLDLRLRPTEIVSGERLRDDWCVVLEGSTIGRIVLVQRAGGKVRWFWTLALVPNSAADRGDAESLDEAKAAFRSRVNAVGPFDPKTMRRL